MLPKNSRCELTWDVVKNTVSINRIRKIVCPNDFDYIFG